MKALHVVAFLLFLSPVLYCQNSQGPAAAKPTVVLLGTVHDLHFHPQFHYSLQDLRAEVEYYRPSVICGEITPEAYQGVMEGYFPPEAAYLSEIAPSLKARFVPADWRMAYAWQVRAASMEPREKQDAAAEVDKKQLEGVKNPNRVSLFDYLHSPEFLSLSDQKFEDILGENTVSDLAAGAWHERNRKIVENCLDASDQAQRIVVVFGANHIPNLRRQFEERGIVAQVATRQFTPGGAGSMTSGILKRWNRNIQNLRGILDGSVRVPKDSLNKVKNSRRIQDLELAIKTYTPASVSNAAKNRVSAPGGTDGQR